MNNCKGVTCSTDWMPGDAGHFAVSLSESCLIFLTFIFRQAGDVKGALFYILNRRLNLLDTRDIISYNKDKL